MTVKVDKFYVKGLLSFAGVMENDAGDIGYYERGALHKENGPALIKHDGTVYYYNNGCLHNSNGPAVCYPDGTCEWWFNDKLIGINDDFNLQTWIDRVSLL